MWSLWTLFSTFYNVLEIVIDSILLKKVYISEKKSKTLTVLIKVLKVTVITAILCFHSYMLLFLFSTFVNYDEFLSAFLMSVLIIVLYFMIFVFVHFLTLNLFIGNITFDTISDEISFSNEISVLDEHIIISKLCADDNNIFVLAHYKKSKEIKPAVFTKRKNKISVIDINSKFDIYRPYILENMNKIKFCSVFNKKTKTSFFAVFSSDPFDFLLEGNGLPLLYKKSEKFGYYVYGASGNISDYFGKIVSIDGTNFILRKPNGIFGAFITGK